MGKLFRNNFVHMAALYTTKLGGVDTAGSHIWSVKVHLLPSHPLTKSVGCTFAAIGLSPKLVNSQKTWLDRIQTRIDATASMLGAMKGIKMTGLTPHLASRITTLRENEIQTAETFRALLVKITTFCKL